MELRRLLKGRLVLFLVGFISFSKTGLILAVFTMCSCLDSAGQKSLDDLNVVFKHDFENNTPGTYKYSEWQRDFLNPEWSNNQSGNTIVQNANDKVNPTKTMQLNFPALSVGPDEGGTQWWTRFAPQDELYISYDILFMPGFQFQLGGKLPSLRGGDLETSDGFVRPSGYDGFSGGMMFKKQGEIAFYSYFAGSQITRYGETIYWGVDYPSDFFSPALFSVAAGGNGDVTKAVAGTWHNITIRVSLNSLKKEGEGNYDGILEGYFDGKLVVQVSKMLFRHTAKLGIEILNITAFFGGDGDAWRNPIAEWIKLDNIIVYSFKDNIKVPRGNELSSADRIVNYWRNFSSLSTFNLPAMPSGLTTTSNSKNSISLKWNDNADNEQGYVIYRSSSLNGNFVEIGRVGENVNTFTDLSLSPATAYYYRIIAYNADGNSDNSEILTTATLDLQIPAAPSSLFASNQTFSGMDLNWTDNSADEQGFIIYRSLASNDGFTVVDSVAANKESFTDNTLAEGASYYYKVCAYNQDGYSPSSTVIFVSAVLEQQQEVNNPPILTSQTFTLRPQTFKNLFVGKIIASDIDSDQELTYSIIEGNENGIFAVDSKNGELRTYKSDVFKSETYTERFTLQVTDNGNEPQSISASIEVIFINQSSEVHIDPENINDPLEDGSTSHPYDSWQDVTWKSGLVCLQKRNTTINEQKIFIGADNVTLGSYGEGDLPVITSETTTYLINAYEKKNITIKDLYLKCDNAVSCIYFLGSGGENNTIEHCKLEGVINAIRIVDGNRFIIKYNTISSQGEAIYSCASITEVYYNVFKNSKTAVNIASKLSESSIYNNVFYNNDESVSVSYASLTLFNNIFYMTSASQIALRYLSDQIVSDHNIFYPEQNGFVEIGDVIYNQLDQLQQNLRLDLNSFTQDPLFKDVYNENFALNNESPAIDNGMNLNLSFDMQNEKVPNSSAPDIGVYEFAESDKKPSPASSESNWLSVYPNPTSGIINVIFQPSAESDESSLDNSGVRVIKVVDIAGKVMLQKELNNPDDYIHETFDLSGISNGIYMIIMEKFGKTFTEKILLNR